MIRALLGGFVLISLVGCGGMSGADIVAVKTVTVKVPVPVFCKIKWPLAPVPYVSLVQFSGVELADALAVYRAMEAELESRIAYEGLLEAAARACVKET